MILVHYIMADTTLIIIVALVVALIYFASTGLLGSLLGTAHKGFETANKLLEKSFKITGAAADVGEKAGKGIASGVKKINPF